MTTGWATDLRAYAAEKLPAYLVPDVIVPMTSLPTTRNGKIDRAALAAIEVPSGPVGPGPRTGLERDLLALFEEVLRLENLSVLTDFFVVGGDSLRAMRLVSRVRSRMGYQLTVGEVFDAPTVEDLARLLDARSAPLPALKRSTTADAVPLSPAQRGLWFINRLEGAAPTYNIPMPLRLRGDLDQEALWKALRALVERHESLRTVFPESAGEPFQKVVSVEEALPELRTVDLDPVGLAAYQDSFEGRGFDLRTDVPLRAELVALGPREHILLLVVHHIACDGWSMAPLHRDLAQAYAGQAPAPLPVQYSDYTLWQREVLGSADDPESVTSRDLTYWTKVLDGLPERLELPADRPRPARASNRGAVFEFSLSPELTRAVDQMAAGAGASAFMVVQSALAALLTRLGAGNDIPIGTPTAGRVHEHLDDMVGFFANSLVLRIDTTGDPSFRELSARVRELTFDAFAHQELPFDTLVEALNPERSLAHHPLFQVMLVFENSPSAPLEIPGLTVAPEHSRLGVARFDLVFNLTPPNTAGDGTAGFIEYATDLFDRATIERIAGYLVAMLERGLAAPETPIGRIELRADAERELAAAWNATTHAVARDTLPRLFEAQAARTPDHRAVVYEDEAASFAELNARANQLARHLVRQGAGPERIVALALPRSLDLIVALWAVVKTGAAYLPVDVDYPAARIAAMLDDAAPILTLTTAAAAGRLPAGTALQPVDDAEFARRVAAESAANLADAERLTPLRPEHPLYVIYTSGSTGRPKGVVMPAAPIVNLLAWHGSVVPAEPDSVTAQFASTSFDPAAQEILSAGTSGKTLAVPPDAIRRDPGRLVPWLDRHRVTELFAPSALIDLVCREASRQDAALPALRHVVQGGEALVLSGAMRRFFDAEPRRRLHNYYGPTETHAATGHTVERPVGEQGGTVPIGAPIWNTRIHLLDAQLRPVPLGAPGEVFIAGDAVARGYLNRPVETARRFVPDPFGPPGSRMYRTGDLARWNNDGLLCFLGRNDSQVKIRGFRIELGEIEATLRAVPGVAQAVVLAARTEHAGVRLNAYLGAEHGVGLDPREVKAFVARRLPAYMVPAEVFVLDSLPTTPNGKVDQRRLTALTPPTAAASPSREPETETEKRLCALLADLLGRESVGVDENFFEIGGHSLVVPRLLDGIRAELGLELSVTDVFDLPTVEGFTRRLRPVRRARPALRRRSGNPDRPADQ
ncbi:amino acid adenylation domain-containing protein [Catenulispora subtropica]|uniref:Carrier domain-containing protein n=1 Tax=Catenulispora subtropica TaxID=450798 RepID=A0ABN2SAM9_9ACTN